MEPARQPISSFHGQAAVVGSICSERWELGFPCGLLCPAALGNRWAHRLDATQLLCRGSGHRGKAAPPTCDQSPRWPSPSKVRSHHVGCGTPLFPPLWQFLLARALYRRSMQNRLGRGKGPWLSAINRIRPVEKKTRVLPSRRKSAPAHCEPGGRDSSRTDSSR